MDSPSSFEWNEPNNTSPTTEVISDFQKENKNPKRTRTTGKSYSWDRLVIHRERLGRLLRHFGCPAFPGYRRHFGRPVFRGPSEFRSFRCLFLLDHPTPVVLCLATLIATSLHRYSSLHHSHDRGGTVFNEVALDKYSFFPRGTLFNKVALGEYSLSHQSHDRDGTLFNKVALDKYSLFPNRHDRRGTLFKKAALGEYSLFPGGTLFSKVALDKYSLFLHSHNRGWTLFNKVALEKHSLLPTAAIEEEPSSTRWLKINTVCFPTDTTDEEPSSTRWL